MLFVVNSAVQTYNAALNQPAYQSSMHRDHATGVEFPAHNANDGSRHTIFGSSPYCAVTRIESNPWWAVDLGHPRTIYRVDLTTSDLTSRKTKISSFTNSITR